jgi:hypothetical protein
VVRVAAALLGLFGLLLALIEADQGNLDVAVVVTGLVLVVAAAALAWAGRPGYWLGLTVAVLVALLLGVALTRDRGSPAGRHGDRCPAAGVGGPPATSDGHAALVLAGPRRAARVDTTIRRRLGTVRVHARRGGGC